MSNEPVTPIFQFGTSRFLQAHADLFIDEALRENAAAGPITVVQSSGDSSRAGRLAALASPEGFPVRISGLHQGQVMDRVQSVRSVRRTLSTATDWVRLVRLFGEQADYVISNTGDNGFAPQPADQRPQFEQSMSFPAKLQFLLRARFEHDARPLAIFPTELIRQNGNVLKSRVLDLCGDQDSAFRKWLEDSVIWANSLVDRIVSQPLQPAGAVAEPYALWAIERTPGLSAPCEHPCVQLVDDLQEAESLKLFILNLGHSYLVHLWNHWHDPPQTVAAFLSLPQVRSELVNLYDREVLPAFGAAGRDASARTYVETTLERFENPFLEHPLSDIAQNHPEKIERRIGGFLAWAESVGDRTPKPRLASVLSGNTSLSEG
ncbi:MAG: mannitol dehydrogenase family protein [Alphaproteobacteria bacterium]|nr:mannitol dehydrogenase family protein [Alphaproteobacteria bacterium]